MTNPFLLSYTQSKLLEKTAAQNLFWVLVLMVLGGGVLLGFVVLGPVRFLVSLPPILLLFVVISLGSLLLLTLGQMKPAKFLTALNLLGVVASVSLQSRSGLVELDLLQVVVLFFLGISALSVTGVGALFTGFWVLCGALVLVAIQVFPWQPLGTDQSLAEWNRTFNPVVTIILYVVGSMAGMLVLVQNRRNLTLMQWDQDIIESSNFLLEQTVAERTRALKAVLDSSGQGFFTFGSDLKVAPPYSQGCVTLFGREIEGEEASALMFPSSPGTALEFCQGLALYFDGRARAGVIFDLLEKETTLGDRTVSIEYREISEGTILCVLTDVTLDRQLAERNRVDETRRALLLKALGHKRFFAGLLAEADALFDLLLSYEERQATPEEVLPLMTAIHTFKGNCGFFAFEATQTSAHAFEQTLGDSQILGEEVDYLSLTLDMKRAYFRELHVIVDVVGDGWLDEAGGIVIPRSAYDKVSQYVSRKFPQEILLVDVLEHYRKMPLKDLFSRFPFVAQATAEKLGKRIQPLEVTGGEVRVIPDRIDGLLSACVHVVNNMVDHGIEAPYIREAQGKPSEGRLSLSIDLEAASVVMRFSDDGQGVSLAAVESKGRALGLLPPDATPSPREILQLLFAPGFTTREEATQVSGRGIGLAAVRQETEALGGRVEIQSKEHSGTTIEIILPLTIFANRRRKTP